MKKTVLLISIILLLMLTSLSSANDTEPFYKWQAPSGSFGIQETTEINWTYFWSLFHQHSMWDLEGYNPVSEEWVSCKEALNITRTRSEDNSSEKITLDFIAPAPITTDYRLTFDIDIRVKEYINKSSWYEYVLTYPIPGYENLSYNVFFNWSDMKDIPGIIFRHGMTEVDNKSYFWFRARRDGVPSGYHLVLDPTFGSKDIGTVDVWNIKNEIRSGFFTCSSDGIAQSITARLYYGYVFDWNVQYRFALYEYVADDDAGVLIAQTEAGSDSGSGAVYPPVGWWCTLNFTSPKPVLKSDTKYFLAAWGTIDEGTSIKLVGDATVTDSVKGINLTIVYAADYPNPMTDEYADNKSYFIYCTYLSEGVFPRPDVFFNAEHRHYTFNRTMGFSYISIRDTYCVFNTSEFHIYAENDTNVTLDDIAGDLTTVDTGKRLLKFDANTSGGFVWFNISGFSALANCTVYRNGTVLVDVRANGSGFISFNNSLWHDNMTFEIYLKSSVVFVFWIMERGVTALLLAFGCFALVFGVLFKDNIIAWFDRKRKKEIG